MKFALRSDQPASFRFQFQATDVRISPLTDLSAPGHAYLQLISTSLRVATKQSISGNHLFRPPVSIEEVQVMFA
jgi:hypothetical protein